MNVREMRASGLALAGLFAAVAAQAQEVHKCTVNGAVTYQAKPCPSGDVVLPAAPVPSEQDQQQAKADLRRQRYQAATGHILDRQIVPPPPPPPTTSTTQTTVYVVPGANGQTYVVRQTTRTPGAPAPTKAQSNCDKLNGDYVAALDKRDQLRAPSELSNHAQILQAAEDDVTRIRQLAQASNCNLR